MNTDDDLVGRGRELDAIDAALAGMGSGNGRFLGMAGDPGIGKTRLLSELHARADAEGRTVLSGTAAEFDRDLPFAVFLDALDAYLGSLDHARLHVRGLGDLAELGAIFPSLSEFAADGEGSFERHRAHRAIAGLLSGLAATRGLVLVLDDLHWCDPASLEVLLAFCRRPPSGAVLVAGAFRSQERVAALQDALALGEAGGTTSLLPLERLSEDEAASLLPADLSAPLRLTTLAAAAGNPFYLQQLARTPPPIGGAADDVLLEGGFTLPAAITASLSEELRALDPAIRRLLEGAAVAGEPFRLGLAAEIADVDPSEALDQIDVAIAAGLVRAAGTPSQFTFRHPLVRRAVYAGSGEGWRLAAHRRAASVLAAQDSDPSSRAHHVAISAEPGEADAIGLLREAAARSVSKAPLSAAQWLQAALALTPDADLLARREILAALGRALLAGGRFDEAVAAATEAVSLFDGEPEPGFVLDLAEIEQWTGRVHAAIDRLGRLGATPSLDPAIAAQLELRLLYLRRWSGEHGLAFEHGQRALAAAESNDVPTVIAGARAAFAEVTANFDVVAGLTQYEEAQGLVAKLPEETLTGALDAFYSLGWAAIHLERYDEALAHFARGLVEAGRSGSVRHLVVLRCDSTEALIRAGRVREAIARAEEAVEVARLYGGDRDRWGKFLWYPLWTRTTALSRCGEYERARVVFADAEAARDEITQPLSGMLMQYQWSAILSGLGQHSEAVACLRETFGETGHAMLPLGVRPPAWEILIRDALARDDPDAARVVLAEATESSAGSGMNRVLSAVARMRATVLEASGDRPGAIVAAKEAIGAGEACGAILDAQRGRLALGVLLAADDARSEGVAVLVEAEAILESVGAEAYRAQAARELRRLGRRTPRRASGGPAAPGDGELAELSGREVEVSELVADQLTNREIAERLFLSEKTVESHLRNIFGKLGVASRVAVAQAIERQRIRE